MVYHGVNEMGLPILNNIYNIYTPGRCVRSEEQYQVVIPKTRLQFSDRDIAIRGGIYWNDTSNIITQSKSLEILKKRLKKYGKI